jgi:uncharacterized protein YdeI (YjbR/CyaY-like superfamily)
VAPDVHRVRPPRHPPPRPPIGRRVLLELDRANREIVVPDDLAAALDADGAARRVYDGLSEGRRRAIVQQVQDAKTAATRERRIAENVSELSTHGGP